MADKDKYRQKLEQDLEQGKENVVEFTSEMPEKAHGLMDKAKGAFEGLMDKAKEAVQDLKEHKK